MATMTPEERRAVLGRLAAEVRRGEVAFPTGTQAALKLVRTLDDPDVHVDATVKLIQADPLIAARVVAVANTVAFNPSGREVADVRAAVARLGFRTLRGIAGGIVARQMAGSCTGRPAAMAVQLWDHTAHVAALASVLARRLTGQDADTALFVGLVHEIGGFFLIARAGEFPGLLDDGMSDWIDNGESELAGAVLQMIGVPAVVLDAVAAYWQGYLTMPPKSLGDTLLLADDLAPVVSPLRRVAHQDRIQGGDAAGAIYLLEGERSLHEILAESAAAVESLTAALRA